MKLDLECEVKRLSASEFETWGSQLVSVYARAMLASPVFGVEIHKPTSLERWQHELKNHSEVYGLHVRGRLIGSSTISHLSQLSRADASEVSLGWSNTARKKAQQFQEDLGIKDVMYILRTFIDPDYQHLGLATVLRRIMLDDVSDRFPQGVIFFTNHLSNNHHIIRSSKKLGFEKLHQGAQVLDNATSNDLWAKVVRATESQKSTE